MLRFLLCILFALSGGLPGAAWAYDQKVTISGLTAPATIGSSVVAGAYKGPATWVNGASKVTDVVQIAGKMITLETRLAIATVGAGQLAGACLRNPIVCATIGAAAVGAYNNWFAAAGVKQTAPGQKWTVDKEVDAEGLCWMPYGEGACKEDVESALSGMLKTDPRYRTQPWQVEELTGYQIINGRPVECHRIKRYEGENWWAGEVCAEQIVTVMKKTVTQDATEADIPKIVAVPGGLPDIITIGGDWSDPTGPGIAVDFGIVPQRAPIGEVYKRADGTYAQDAVKITAPANSTVITVTPETHTGTTPDEANGKATTQPVPGTGTDTGSGSGSGTGTDTGDVAEKPTDLCALHPEILACAQLGEKLDETIPKDSRAVSWTAEALGIPAQCPAPIPLPNGQSLSFTPYCNASNVVRPVVIALASLMALGICIAAVRS